MSICAPRVLRSIFAVVSALALIAASEPTWAQGSPIEFSAIGDIPYGASEEVELEQHIINHNLFSPSEFFVHLGDLKGGDPNCVESDYTTASSILGDLFVPTFVVPGDNEWTDCIDPVQAWTWWTSYFLGFEQNYCGTPAVESQLVRPENFAFVQKGVLFIGINHVGGTNQDPIEQAARLQDDADWVSQQMLAKAGVVRAAVVFAQESPKVEPFETAFRIAAATFGKPVAYIHGDNHEWVLDFPFAEPNILRVQVERGTLAEPPIRVTVTMDPDPNGAFVVERDPWPAGTPVLNRAPCVDAGPDLITDISAPPLLAGLASDDGVPTGALTTIWSSASGPAPVLFGNIFSLSTTPSFSVPGTYQLRLEADDSALTSSSDVYLLVRGSSSGDEDSDGATDDVDNCPAISNAGQVDMDGDGFGDDCDPDVDGDGFRAPLDCNDSDAAINPNPLTAEDCGDGIDNNCDGATDAADLQCGACPTGFDADGDGHCDWDDICPTDYDPGQEDTDADGFGDACDICPASGTLNEDPDGDGLCQDNCPAVFNPTQDDVDVDGVGDVCDACDLDGTGGACTPLGTVFDAPVIAIDDDAEEKVPSGAISLTSSDLDIVNDNGKFQMVGLRLQGLAVPRAATIHRAYLQFVADEIHSDVATLVIEGEAADDSQPFTAVAFDLSSRTATAAWAGWAPLAWLAVGDAGARQRTSDLSAVVQEIVDRPGWVSGSALSLFLTALDTASTRVADSRNASAVNAPVLHIDYTPQLPIVTISAPGEGSIWNEADLVGFVGSAIDPQEGDVTASLMWDSSLDGTIGGGASFSTSSLSLGVHTITASASDSQSNIGTDVITLTVAPNSPPVVTLTAPVNGSSSTETDLVSFVGSASDVEDGDLSASLAWTSDLDGAIGSGASFALSSLSVGAHLLTASVTDGQGAIGFDSITFTVDSNSPPVLAILSPPDGSSFVETDPITFTGSASDAEDGDLAANLSWSSDVDGPIGIGATFELATLSLGTHQITASVTDSHGAAGMAMIGLTIVANTAPVVAISEPVQWSTSTVGTPLTFTGTASDAEDGDISAALLWSSDLDGAIGSGASFVTSTLSQGTHLVTSSATDAHGLEGFSTVVTVRLPEPGTEGLLAGLLGLAALARRRRSL